MILYACSSNTGKLKEFAFAAQAAGREDVQIFPLANLEQIPPPEETGATFAENAALKALYYSQFSGSAMFADDSGLEAEALGGEPGIFSARYAGPGASDADNIQLLLGRLGSASNRHARFVCAIAVAHFGRLVIAVQGTVEGELLETPRGSLGFGYDPIFVYPPLGKTFAELTPEVKFSVSHRGNALRALFASKIELI